MVGYWNVKKESVNLAYGLRLDYIKINSENWLGNKHVFWLVALRWDVKVLFRTINLYIAVGLAIIVDVRSVTIIGSGFAVV